jgi:hypothetical protein
MLVAAVLPAVALAGRWQEGAFEKQLKEAPLIVRGKVVAVEVREEAVPEAQMERAITSYFQVEVLETLRSRGTAPARLTLLVLGGAIGGRSFSVSSEPVILVGDTIWLFARELRPNVHVAWSGELSALFERSPGLLSGPVTLTDAELRRAIAAADSK